MRACGPSGCVKRANKQRAALLSPRKKKLLKFLSVLSFVVVVVIPQVSTGGMSTVALTSGLTSSYIRNSEYWNLLNKLRHYSDPLHLRKTKNKTIFN